MGPPAGWLPYVPGDAPPGGPVLGAVAAPAAGPVAGVGLVPTVGGDPEVGVLPDPACPVGVMPGPAGGVPICGGFPPCNGPPIGNPPPADDPLLAPEGPLPSGDCVPWFGEVVKEDGAPAGKPELGVFALESGDWPGVEVGSVPDGVVEGVPGAGSPVGALGGLKGPCWANPWAGPGAAAADDGPARHMQNPQNVELGSRRPPYK